MTEIKTTNDKTTSTPPPKKSNKKTAIVVAILAVIIILQGVKIYLDHQESVARDTELTNTEEELATTMQKLSDISAELEEKIAQIQELGGNVDELEKAKADIEAELARSQKANRSTIRSLKDKVGGYETLLKAKDEEIEHLKSLNDELLTENTSLKTEKNQLSDSINRIKQSSEKLADKVAVASQLKAENIEIFAVNNKGKERDSPFKARQIDKIKVVFNIAENKVAPIEGKDIIVRIVDQNDQVIFDVAKGSGTFMVDGKEVFYTASQEILFDNTKQQLTFEYQKGSDWEDGIYTMEVYTDEYRMGVKQFEVK